MAACASGPVLSVAGRAGRVRAVSSRASSGTVSGIAPGSAGGAGQAGSAGPPGYPCGLSFDRYPEVAGQLARAIWERPAGKSAVSALRDTLVAAARVGQPPYGMQADMIPWWRTVAASHALQARARELADQLGAELAEAMAATGAAEPELAAALAVAAYRTVHLQAIRAILAGEEAATVAARQPGRIRSALSAVDQMTA